jgi:hypothetical protein
MSSLLIVLIILVGLLVLWVTFRNKKPAAFEPSEEDTAALKTWHEKYFKEIIFPVIIFKGNDYLGVSSIEEYYFDADIEYWFLRSDCADYELVDSMGQTYNFREIESEECVPHRRTGAIDHEELRDRLAPLLYMPEHKEGINKTMSVKSIIELILTG